MCDVLWAGDEPLRLYLDHLDAMVHELARQVGELHALLTPHGEALGRAAAMLDRGKGVRDYLAGRKK